MSSPSSSPSSPGQRSETAAFGLTVLAAVFWGSNFEATHIILGYLPPWTAAAARFGLAAIVIVIWMRLAEGPGLQALRRNAVMLPLLGLIGVAGFNAALFLGMKTSSPVTAALIMGTSPLTTNLLDALIGRRHPGAMALAGMGISLVGVALTVGAFSGASFAMGDLMILAGSVGWALYTIGCRRWVHGASPLETTAWTTVFGAVALAIPALLLEHPVTTLTHAVAPAWGALFWMAIPGSVLGILFWQVGIAVRGPAATSILFNLVPVSALVIAALMGHAPGPSQVAGVAVAIAGVLLASGRLSPVLSRLALPRAR